VLGKTDEAAREAPVQAFRALRRRPARNIEDLREIQVVPSRPEPD
jgi:hypothetical protein